MNEQWQNVIIKEISFAMYVSSLGAKHIHKNRPYHGLILNDATGVKDYIFDDGQVMRTEKNSLFYLPKGASYRVKTVKEGGCYAINFNAPFSDTPFSIALRHTDTVLHNFKAATTAWMRNDAYKIPLAMRALYDAIWQMQKEIMRPYTPDHRISLIRPAIEQIEQSFTSNDLSVSHLASLCDMSEVYFRRLFMDTFGISPKEYMIQRRMEYARTLLLSGDFSVSETASLCGYAEPCHFSREFTRRNGISPSRFLLKAPNDLASSR